MSESKLVYIKSDMLILHAEVGPSATVCVDGAGEFWAGLLPLQVPERELGDIKGDSFSR